MLLTGYVSCGCKHLKNLFTNCNRFPLVGIFGLNVSDTICMIHNLHYKVWLYGCQNSPDKCSTSSRICFDPMLWDKSHTVGILFALLQCKVRIQLGVLDHFSSLCLSICQCFFCSAYQISKVLFVDAVKGRNVVFA